MPLSLVVSPPDPVQLAIERFAVAASDSRMVDEAAFRQIITPSSKQGLMNAITRFQAGSGDLNGLLDRILEPYDHHDVACWWLQRRDLAEPGVEDELLRRGFHVDHEAFGFIRSTEGLPRAEGRCQSSESSIEVERVTPSNLDDYITAALDGRPPSDRARAYFLQAMEREGENLEFYLARHEGEPAATGGTILLDTPQGQVIAGSLTSGFVRPQFRRRGLYRALVAHRLQSLHSRNVPWAVVLSKKETSAPILLRLGFKVVCELTTYERGQKEP